MGVTKGRSMTRQILFSIFAALAISGSFPAYSQTRAAPVAVPAVSPFTYADVADLATRAPLVVDARIRKATVLPPERAAGLGADKVRIYVEADVLSLIRSTGPLAARVAWLVDLPRDAKGRAPKLNKLRVLAFARPVGTGQIALVAPNAQLAWDSATDTLTRSIITEAIRPGAPARVTGIANGFHQSGTLPGEGESQFFVETETGDPVTLTVLRAPDRAPQWAVAFGEIVDGTAVVPARDTLGWYRLACGLPRTVAAERISGNDDGERAAAMADYRFIVAQLGECRRTRSPPGR
jgi:hypothetical protein